MCISATSYLPRSRCELAPTYVVTGRLFNGKRFRCTTASRMHAFGIALWRGSVWVILPTGKRKRLKRVAN